MQESTDLTALVRSARTGNKDDMNRLAKVAGERLSVYIERIAFKHDVTQDVVQESLIEMFKFLDKLEREDRFWPWLRKIAINKLHHHYARERAHRNVSMEDVEHTLAGENRQEGFADMVGQELRHVVVESMSTLKPRYREVLVMRCYEEMDYAEIAEEIGGTEFSARVLFFRAKNALAKQLTRRGLGRGALLGALVLFGKLTAPSKAAAAQITVTAATTEVGLAAAATAVITGKAAVATLTAASIIAAGSVVLPPMTSRQADTPTAVVSDIDSGPSVSGQHVNTCWYFYPQGPGGPVMMRRTKPIGAGPQSICQWLQNGTANYYYDRDRNAVTINNYHLWHTDLSIVRLPTDSPRLGEFLSRMDGRQPTFEPISTAEKGLLVIAREDSEGGLSHPWTTRHINVLNEDYFQCDWPDSVTVQDLRDDLHKRGWACLRVSGRIGNETVTGEGIIPLNYTSLNQYNPSLRWKIGNRLQISDDIDGTYMYHLSERTLTTYPRGSFFDGLLRPWLGLHTIDIVRRDAAERQIAFQSRLSKQQDRSQVLIDNGKLRMTYTIDMNRDWIDTILLSAQDSANQWKDVGVLEFMYEAAPVPLEGWRQPGPTRYQHTSNSMGMMWLLNLAQLDSAG